MYVCLVVVLAEGRPDRLLEELNEGKAAEYQKKDA